MSLIVFEEDPLVRDDICEAIAEEFPTASLRVFDKPDDLPQIDETEVAGSVMIISLPSSISAEELWRSFARQKAGGLVIISNAPEGFFVLPQNSYYIQRPFSSDQLVSAVKTVLSDLPSPQS